MYLQSALSGAADPQSQQPSTAYDRQSDHMSYGASPIYQPRATFEATSSAYGDFERPKTQQVSSPNPQRGSKGALVSIQLDSSRDLLSPTPLNATLMFGKRSVSADLTRLEAREQDMCYRYLVSGTAPSFSETDSSSLKIALRLQLHEQSGLDAGLVDVGEWLYEDGKQSEHCSSPQVISRKRKVTDEPSDTLRSTKRVGPSEQPTIESQDYVPYAYPSASLAYPQSLHNIVSTMDRKYTAYGRSQLQQSLQPESDAMGSQVLIGGASTSQSQMRPPMGQTSSWNSSYGAGFSFGRKSQPNAAPSFQISSKISSSPANPRLIRSTLVQHPCAGTTSAGSSSDGSLNPYTLYPSRAVLEIRGDLEAMQTNWTPEECAAQRRIVRFWREQNGTTVNAYFKPVRTNEQPLPHETNERRISCIYWEERDKYYITSVDTISLLESLVDLGFGIDEKNRIRRNLEGYKPCTVSKGKPESERFFKLIMGFSNPKPRIIEKDVKVFDWSILEQALQKVFSKYVCRLSLIEDACNTDPYQSADPASIIGPLARPPRSNFSGRRSEAGASQYSTLSSRSTSGSTASSAYAQTLDSSTLSPHHASHGLSSYSQASPSQHFPAPSLSHSYTVPTLGSQYIPDDSSNSPYAVQASIPSLSSAYTASTIGRRRSSGVPPDNALSSTMTYSGGPGTSTSFTDPYAPQEPSEARATLGLPGRASLDLSAYLDAYDASSGSIGDAQYRRYSSVNNDTEAKQFKEE